MIYDGIDGMVGVGIRTSFLWLVGLNPNPRCFSHVHEEPPRRKPSISEYYLRCRDEMTAWDHLHRTNPAAAV